MIGHVVSYLVLYMIPHIHHMLFHMFRVCCHSSKCHIAPIKFKVCYEQRCNQCTCSSFRSFLWIGILPLRNLDISADLSGRRACESTTINTTIHKPPTPPKHSIHTTTSLSPVNPNQSKPARQLASKPTSLQGCRIRAGNLI